MLSKNILKGLLLMSLVAYVQAQENTPSIHVACLLVAAQGNSLHIERYTIEDLESGTLYLPKKERSKRRVVELVMQEPESSLESVQWDEAGSVTIRTKNKLKSCDYTDYSLNIMSLFNDEVAHGNEIFALCFDCDMVPVDEDIRSASDVAEWKSCAQVAMPVGSEVAALHFVFDNKIKAACGLFISDEAFSVPLRYAGKIQKSDALAAGLLEFIKQERINDEPGAAQVSQIIEVYGDQPIVLVQDNASEFVHVVPEIVSVQDNAPELTSVTPQIDSVVAHNEPQQLVHVESEIETGVVLAEEFVEQQSPGLWDTLQQQAVGVFQAIHQGIISLWDTVSSFLFGSSQK